MFTDGLYCIRCPYHVCVSKISKLSFILRKPFDNFGLANPIHLLIIVLRTHICCELYFHRHFAREKNLLDPNTTIKTIRKLFPPTKKDRLVFLLQLLHLQVTNRRLIYFLLSFLLFLDI